ncbi:MAG: T9SS type A sorting domain-containing protein [Muribaculaceae bacterium]|nr:T9SS type A sorting domain-containing protein [Muribaculaceae bacterium]
MITIKTFFLSMASLATASLCQAQQAVVAYDYDAAGNSIARRLVADPPQQSPPRSPAVSHKIGSVAVSPSVTNGPVTVSTTADVLAAPLPWTLTDAQGRVMGNGRLTESSTTLTIDGASGVYLLTVIKADGPATFKIIKQ